MTECQVNYIFFHMSGALGSSDIENIISLRTEPANTEVKGECSHHK